MRFNKPFICIKFQLNVSMSLHLIGKNANEEYEEKLKKLPGYATDPSFSQFWVIALYTTLGFFPDGLRYSNSW